MLASGILLVLLSTALHAGWNLLARARRARQTFLRVTLVTAVVGLAPALAGRSAAGLFPAPVWGLLVLAGVFQAVYYLGLTRGYQSYDFTVVYPLARSLPIFLLALVDFARGRAPAPLAWLGMALVMAGCAVTPLESLRGASLGRYLNRAMLWIVVTALGTVGYTTVDKLAAELIAPGPAMAARYGIMEMVFTLPPLWLLLKALRQEREGEPGWAGWGWPALTALGVFGGYWLVLWAYQLVPYASYVVATRQLSIVFGVIAGGLLFHEPARRLRIGASLMIVAGVVCIAFAV